MGHFLTPDYRAPDIYDPSTFTEPYAYAAGNPMMYVDLNGLQPTLGSAAKSLSLDSPDFWKHAKPGLYVDNDIYFVILDDKSQMIPIVRDREELFEATVLRESKAKNIQIVINGMFYDLTKVGISDVLMGSDPVHPSHTTPEGFVISEQILRTGASGPNYFYVANNPIIDVSKLGPRVKKSNQGSGTTMLPLRAFQQVLDQLPDPSSYSFGFGDPPRDSEYAIGGVGPLIINGLEYGIGNLYSSNAPPGGPKSGKPPAAFKPYLVQRNNLTFKDAMARSRRTGKISISHNSGQKKLALLIQPHASSPGITHEELRAKLVRLGFDNSVFLDGSDSVMLFIDGTFLIRQAPNKNESNTVGIGFKIP